MRAQFVERSVSATKMKIQVMIKLLLEKMITTKRKGTAMSTATPQTIGSALSLRRRYLQSIFVDRC